MARTSTYRLDQPVSLDPPDVLPPDLLCVFNFGQARTVKLFVDLSDKGQSYTLPVMSVALTPEQAVTVRGILRRALADVAAVARGERFAV